MVKLLDFAERVAELEASTNPFAMVVLAHLAALRSNPDRARLEWKVELVRGLVRTGWQRTTALRLPRLIDWFLLLPPPLQNEFDDALATIGRENDVPFVMSFERKMIERGRQEGRQEGRVEALQDTVLRLLEQHHGRVPASLRGSVRRMTDEPRLVALVDAVSQGADITQVRRLLRNRAAPGRDAAPSEGARRRGPRRR